MLESIYQQALEEDELLNTEPANAVHLETTINSDQYFTGQKNSIIGVPLSPEHHSSNNM